jgi:hypothetical protein
VITCGAQVAGSKQCAAVTITVEETSVPEQWPMPWPVESKAMIMPTLGCRVPSDSPPMMADADPEATSDPVAKTMQAEAMTAKRFMAGSLKFDARASACRQTRRWQRNTPATRPTNTASIPRTITAVNASSCLVGVTPSASILW